MKEIQSAKDASRAHWLIIGTFSPRPAGRRFAVARDSFDQALQEACLELDVSVADRFGAESSRAYKAVFSNLRSFTLKAMVQSVEPLGRLTALQMRLTKPSGRPSPQELLAEIETAVGQGALWSAMVKERPDSESQSAPRPPAGGKDAVDALFEQAEVAAEREPKNAIDHFVRATQSPHRSSATEAKFFQRAASLLEEAIYATAADIVRSSAVVELESVWRGLKFLVDQTPAGGEILIEALDVASEGVVDALAQRLEEPPFERPDAVFVFAPPNSLETLASLADLAEQLSLPCVVAAEAALLGIDQVDSAGTTTPSALTQQWNTLRQGQPFRWLSVATNPVVVLNEGAGAAKRVVYASPAVAIAAAMTASYRDRGTFARVIGAEGKLRAPATRTIAEGRFVGTAAPTRDFYTIDTQKHLASLGIIGIGSARHSDQLILSSIPTAYDGADAVPLPAQLLTGRIVRFAEFVMGELSFDCPDQEVIDTFASASQVFLFPAMEKVARLAAHTVIEQGSRFVEVEVKASSQVATIPFEISFRLPLATTSPATA